MSEFDAMMAVLEADIEYARAEGIPSLQNLISVAEDYPFPLCDISRRFLLNLQSCEQADFNLHELRVFSADVREDVLNVLRLYSIMEMDIHEYIEHGAEIFQRMRAKLLSESTN